MDKFSSQVQAGKVAASIHQAVSQILKVDTNLLEIENLVIKKIASAGMTASFKGYRNYPASSCICINNEVVHGIPRDYTIKDGDVVTVDFGVTCNGFMVDTARTYLIGNVSDQIKKLHQTTQVALDRAIDQVKVGQKTGTLGEIIQSTVENAGFNIIEDLTGHGVGETLQEKPTIYNYGTKGKGETLKLGDAIAIEPITSIKKTEIFLESDGWMIMPKADTITMQIEDTVYIGQDGPIILTR
ncbi:type I methionyl aminopeptidase [Candidatus Berkelbacteria bacterium]|nr:type I methionyl aminopeptidase [Candidatus Berkelbacteria bacterium]